MSVKVKICFWIGWWVSQTDVSAEAWLRGLYTHVANEVSPSNGPCHGTNPNIHAAYNISGDTTTQKVQLYAVLLPKGSSGHELITLLEHSALGSCLNQKFTLTLLLAVIPSWAWAVPSQTEVNQDPQPRPLHTAFLYSLQSILKFVTSWNSPKTLSGGQIEKTWFSGWRNRDSVALRNLLKSSK